jgi:ATP-binding cassette subfamily C protein CydCD
VKENLLVANPHASESRMINALRDAGLQAWFESLPDGLETVLGDSARGMSGGEIQRFGLARALTTDSAFIILDEPTEHLDQDTADSIWQTVNRLFHDRGLIIISHDPRIAMDCDQVMVLDLGRVVEHDAPNNLKIDGWLHRMAEVDGLIG